MRVSIAESILEVPSEQWSRVAGGSSPFIEFPFLAALERSGSVGAGTGWRPRYFLAWEGEQLMAAIPAWLKDHSYGEYIFDWAWADGAHRAGISYYPKAVVAVPFTPATDRRLLRADDAPAEVGPALVDALLDDARGLGLSSVHWLCTPAEDQALLADRGHVLRETLQYHWRNRSWECFEDYLATMRGKRRREIRRERRRLAEAGYQVEMRQGPELEEEEWEAIDRFYRSTAARKWGHPYLSETFFSELRSCFPEAVRFAAARHEGRLVAGALFFERSGALYGRYWGCDSHHRHLHFETCFYSPIDYCIREGIQLYEAGAQGDHKLPRGFDPVGVHSAHWIADPRLGAAVEDFCRAEQAQTRRVIQVLSQHGAFESGARLPSLPLIPP